MPMRGLCGDMNEQLRAVGAGVGVGILGLLVALVLTLILGVVIAVLGLSVSPVLGIVLTLLVTQGVAFMGVGYGYLRYRDIPLSAVGVELPSLRQVGVAVGAFVVSIVYLIVAGQVVSALGVQTAENAVVEMGMENPQILLYLIPGAYLLIGPGEELLFRGVVQTRIRQAFGPVAGVFIASVIFAAIHIYELVNHLMGTKPAPNDGSLDSVRVLLK